MRTRKWWLVALVPLVAALLVGLAACGESLPTTSSISDGNPRRGAQLMASYGCGACHHHGDVDGADGRIAPPLDDFHQRRFVAGVLVNDVENLARWIQSPQTISPGNGMPDLGVTESEAVDMAAFLLRER
jgi:cytochrome c